MTKQTVCSNMYFRMDFILTNLTKIFDFTISWEVILAFIAIWQSSIIFRLEQLKGQKSTLPTSPIKKAFINQIDALLRLLIFPVPLRPTSTTYYH